jgi:hypothetical protein
MSPTAAKSSPSRHHKSKPSTTTTPPTRAKMPILFNTIRASIYGSVLLFTGICLAMAGHFQSVLAASDLTRFVPFAIFVCSVSLFIFFILLSFSYCLRERNPISTRIELASLGLVGMFWLILGVYLTTSDAQSADVECFTSTDLQVPVDEQIADFHTTQYQAMYRVLNAFSLMNAVLIIVSCLTLLFLAIRRHRKGDEHMWHGPVTSCAWFNNYENAKLTRGKSSSSSILPISSQAGQAVFTEKPERAANVRRQQSSRRQHRIPTDGDRYQSSPQRQHRHAPPVRQGSGNRSPRTPAVATDIEHGGMLNPYSRVARGHSSRR